MRIYRRAHLPGGCYFFTVNLAERNGNGLLIKYIGELRDAFRRTIRDHPFKIDAIVVLPDHLHCVWRLPSGDEDFPLRWRLIKARFSSCVPSGEHVSTSRARQGERGIWQRRYREHLIRDQQDYENHIDYIHINPVKHGHAGAACD